MSLINLSEVLSPQPGPVPLQEATIRLHPQDNVAIARRPLPAGILLSLTEDLGGGQIIVRDVILSGHKLALQEIPAGDAVRRYGQIIGFASQPIGPGEHVHVHNLGLHDYARQSNFAADAYLVDLVPEGERRTFLGFRRPDGRVGTRNYLAVLSTVNCSAHTCREIAHSFTPERLVAYPNVDGVIALTHSFGCALRIGGPDYTLLQRTLAGMARHPNIGAAIWVGLGCETKQASSLIENYHLQAGNGADSRHQPVLSIQDQGGIRKTVQAGIAAIQELLPVVNAVQRTPQSASELMVALQCGGSDAWSGVTANPMVGRFADALARQGGTVVLAETTEIYGAEHLLIRRAITPQVGQKLIEKVTWWEQYARQMGIEIDNNRSIGNAAGGLTTIFEKSLGAVAKAGSTPLTGVFDYAEPVTARGFTFMDTPGYDPVSVTGQVAGGCNLVLFTTGRGSVFGFKPAPSIKISSNSQTYQCMVDDMDVNAGLILEGVDIDQAAAELFELVIAVASGQQTKSEAQAVGEAEFNPWNLGALL